MATDAVVVKRSAGRKLAGLFHGRPRLQIGSLLAAPLTWLVVLYLGSLGVLLVNVPVYREIIWRTVRTAILVTVTDAIIAFPIAFFMAKVAGRNTKALLVVAVLMPLWASYLVKIIAWRAILAEHGVLNWALSP